ncbi:MAG: hypothetical protein ACTSYV_01040 [Candidatus Heimdallarchaeaceae archaeon]
MSIKILKSIREVERECEQKIKKAETAKHTALMEAEKEAVLKVRNAEIHAQEEASKILSGVKEKVEREYVNKLNIYEEAQNNLKNKMKEIEKKAIDLVISKIV